MRVKGAVFTALCLLSALQVRAQALSVGDLPAPGWLDRAAQKLLPASASCQARYPRFYEVQGASYTLQLGSQAVPIIGRKDWGAGPPIPEGRSWKPFPQDQPFCQSIRRITVHHTHSLYTIQSLQRSHQNQADPKADIGYHFFIDVDGKIYEARPLGYMGSHSEGDNSDNVGIVLNGDFTEKAPSPAQIAALRQLVPALRCPCAPLEGLWTHQSRKALRYPGDPAHFTACPGTHLAEEVYQLGVEQGMNPVLTPAISPP